MDEFDIIVIGGGPGGYVAAIRASQLGKKTACIESRGALGGTCLNIGCIPSKSLLHSSELFKKANSEFKSLGINTGNISIDISKMMMHKKKSVDTLTKGVEFLFKKNKVTYFKGHGSFLDTNNIEIKLNDGTKQSIKGKNIVIATGSSVLSLPNITIDEKVIVSSTGALSLSKIPKKLIVIGGGYIGLEMGSVWSRLGSQVEVIECLDHITPGMDKEISDSFLKILKKQGLKFHLSTKVNSVNKNSNGAIVEATSKEGDIKKFDADVVLMSVGRKPNTNGLNLKKVGVELDDKGRIKTGKNFDTNIQNIFAIGDVISGPMLAHKAEEEGIAVAEYLAGKYGHVNYDVIPGVVYTSPEVAYVGKTEEELMLRKISYNVGKFPFLANSRAKINDEADGFVKILADKTTDKILGVHMIGPDVGNMIAEMALAMEFGASAEDVARTCHAHPTLTEAIKEAALAVDKRPIHF
ncbi:MAG: dihydrolipoyl dehydrogenase [Candidatus Pelagibacter sp.]|nr:dihydrolipoyl dehydrogenase [Candidatus Pelagibacter sp.]|tara:strand:- start:69942 stop:71342 length:1401 start_codon:yes stop_codon:yes gene_type:complete